MPEQNHSDAVWNESARLDAHGASEVETTVGDRTRAMLEFARHMDWIVLNWAREARPKEGGQ